MRYSLPLAAAATLALAACDGVVTYDDHSSRGGYYIGELDYAGRKGAIETVISGNPFGGDKARFDARVLDYMQGQNRGQPANFVPGPGENTDPLYKVVVAFDLPANVTADRMCRQYNTLPARPQPDRVSMSIAFCEGDTAKSDSSGFVRGVRGVADPKFVQLVRHTTYVMIPDEGYLHREMHDDSNLLN